MLNALKKATVAVATAGLVYGPVSTNAAEPAQAVNQQSLDVQLDANSLNGRVVTAAGRPASTDVVVFQGTKEIARTRTDATGAYRFDDLKSGNYIVATPKASRVIRAWSGAAPAKATGMLTIQEGSTVRGNYYGGYDNCGTGYCGDSCSGYGHGYGGGYGGGGSSILALGVTAGILATTIAVVSANDDDGRGPATP